MTTKISKKILASILFIAVSFFLSVSYAFANNNGMQDAAQGVRNVVGGAENGIENAAKGVADGIRNVTGAMDHANDGNNQNNANNMSTSNTGNNTNNTNTVGMMTTTDGNNGGTRTATTDGTNGGYTATRTATSDGTTFFGMTSNTLNWVVLALVAFAIIVLIWGYVGQDKAARKNDNDDVL